MYLQIRPYKYWFLIPALSIYLLFFLVPSILSFYYSFTDWDMDSSRAIKFIGLDNFNYLFEDDVFILALKNTLLFTIVTTFFKITIGLFLALALNEKLKTLNFLRTAYFFPSIMSLVVVGLIFSSLLRPEGMVNLFLRNLGLDFLAVDWLGSRVFAIWSVILVEIWKWCGFCMIVFLAGLQAVSKDYLEAANIDGASYYQKLKSIILPLIMSSITVNVILNLIGGLKVFDIVYVMTNGGPGNSSQVLNGIVYSKFGGGLYGLGTAANLVLLIFIAVIVLSSLYILRSREVEL
ncbi:sugar ABC transporter permease [Paenibacillus psychroresistens]|uniref:Sugar ABC transporter permease n=1 Tax=Paenibacillus psychroresistens TaxID=1778678 RepID=A0A6B8RHR9_9BACL|nr:sugar ABC transporter permease [Paenibacillus psychroresistens]QGQ95102.1 sugar ABC transporter permease [Paenibacillus psychroresistens]